MARQADYRMLAFLMVVGLLNGPMVRAEVRPPTGERDVIAVIARYNPHLYRLVGQQPIPFGTAQFYSPQVIVADPRQQCFYVFDEPRLVTETHKIWRIESDGSARVIFEAMSKRQGGPFSNPTNMSVDHNGQLLIADTVTGLWQLGTDGRLRCLLDGKNRPLFKISAVADSPRGLMVATNFLDTVTGGKILSDPPRGGVGDTLGRQQPINIWKNQGGLYLVPPNATTGQTQTVLVNRKVNGANYETYWRTARQILVDSAGRCVLVDAGSTSKHTERVYINPGDDDPREGHENGPKRTTTSDINGGVFVLHPNGSFDELTFKTPNARSGPLRHPHSVAQWSDDTYLVADPDMYVEGVRGTGGLFLLKLDGSREARWPFGERLRPTGVAILRNAGPAAQATPSRPIRLANVVGTRQAGKITRITSVSWQRMAGTGILGPKWDEQPTPQAEQKLRSLFENARWSIRPDGTLLFSAAGVNPQTQGNPLVIAGKVTPLEGMLSISGSYQTQSLFDTQLGSLDARLYSTGPDTLLLDMKVTIFSKTERLKGTFEQMMTLKNN